MLGKSKKKGEVKEKEAPKTKESTPMSVEERMTILANWLGKKRLQFTVRESEGVYDRQMAKRLIEIMDNEPEHPVTKALKGVK